MDQGMVEELKRRHGFERWQGRNALGECLFIWDFFLSGNELPGWKAQRIRPVSVPGFPAGLRSIWTPEKEGARSAVAMEVFSCDSRSSAHEFLIQAVAEFESPDIELRDDLGAGDLAFSRSKAAVVVLARANLVVVLKNGGEEVIALTDIASVFDHYLISKPKVASSNVNPQVATLDLTSADVRAGAAVRVAVEASDPLKRQVWLKLFSASGEIEANEGAVLYTPGASGPQSIQAFAINANGGVDVRRLDFQAT